MTILQMALFLRSKAQGCEEGEKASEYFLTIEKKKQES